MVEKTLLEFCKKKHLLKQAVVIGYSGGVDSQVLLYAFAKLYQQGALTAPIKAVHVNHGLSDNAANWQTFCQQQASALAIDFMIEQVTLREDSNESLEEQARNARYNALASHMVDDAVLFTAHHQDDQVETLLLALKRGAGVQGLGGMQAIRPFDKHSNRQIARPLLTLSRAQIEDYAQHNKLQWIEDESNQDTRYDRNFIRAEILPLLKARWPGINDTISRSSLHCQHTQQLVNQLAEADYTLCLQEDSSVHIEQLATLTQERQHNVLRHFIGQQGGKMPSLAQIQQMVNMYLSESNDSVAKVQLGNNWLRRYKKGLYFTKDFADLSQWQVTIRLEQLPPEWHVDLPDGLGTLVIQQHEPGNDELIQVDNQWLIARPEGGEQLTIDFNSPKGKCFPEYRTKRRELKKVLQELNIPPWRRKRLPFVKFSSDLAAVLPLFTCKGYVGNIEQKCLKIRWHETQTNK